MNKILYFVFVQLFLLLIVCQDVKVEFVLLARTGNDAKSVSYGFKWLLVGTGMTLPLLWLPMEKLVSTLIL